MKYFDSFANKIPTNRNNTTGKFKWCYTHREHTRETCPQQQC